MGSQFIVYTTSAFSCPYCVQAKNALTKLSYTYEERDIVNPNNKAELLQKRPTAHTVPQIFFADDTYLGGCDDLMALIESDTLAILVSLNSTN